MSFKGAVCRDWRKMMFGWFEEIRKAESRKNVYEQIIHELKRKNEALNEENVNLRVRVIGMNSRSKCFDMAIKAGATQSNALRLAKTLHDWIYGESK